MILEGLIAILVIWLAVSKANSTQARNLEQAKEGMSAWLVTFVGVVVAIVIIVPYAYRWVKPAVGSQYGMILDDLGNSVGSLRPPNSQSLPPLQLPAPPPADSGHAPTPIISVQSPPVIVVEAGESGGGAPMTVQTSVEYVVTAGDNLKKIADRYGVTIADIVAANGLDNPDRISAGQKLMIPQQVQVTTTPAPLPTATPPPPVLPSEDQSTAPPSALPGMTETELEEAFLTIGQYRLNGQIGEAKNTLMVIQQQHPNNETVVRTLEEIAYYEQLREHWGDLDRPAEGARLLGPGDGELFYDESQAEYVDGLLSGYQFEVVRYSDRFGLTANSEVMTVRCVVPGWMYGFEFDIQAIHGTSRGANNVGNIFQVN